MKNLPEGMIPDRDNQVYYDSEKGRLYIIEWVDTGNNDYAIRHYLNTSDILKVDKLKKSF